MTRDRRCVSGGIALALGVLAWLGVAGAAAGGDAPTAPVSRTLEPVIVTGDRLPQFNQAPLGELYLYAFNGAEWTPLPFQIDEVDASGVYTVEDGLLDANDELVFMAMDLALQAAASEWLADAASQASPRYELAVANPLAPAEQGWVYLYRSATLDPPPVPDYVDWDPAGSRFVAGAYVLGVTPALHAGVDSLELNGSGVDVLDRSKTRINVDCYFGLPWPINVTLTEDDLAGQMDSAPTVDGPVRAGGGSPAGSTWSYYAFSRSRVVFDLAGMQPPPECDSIAVRWLRLSSDWLNPASSGMAPAMYYDANKPGGVAVDGAPDSVPETPLSGWWQLSGARGSVVSLTDAALGGGELRNYYLDNQAVDDGDTGDQRSYGDAGVRINNPSGQVVIDMLTFVLDASAPNVGALFQDYHDHALEVAATAQSYDDSCHEPAGPDMIWAPRPVYAGSTTTFTATVAGGTPPFTMTWTFGDDGGSAWGNPVSHTFALTGTFPVTLTVSNACAAAAPVARDIAVYAPGSTRRVYLPLVWKH